MAFDDNSAVNITGMLPEQLIGYNVWAILVGLFVVVISVIVMFCLTAKKIKQKVEKVLPKLVNRPKYRFRKRDKIAFYGNKMLRKVKSFTKKTVEAAPGRSRLRKRQLILKIAKRLLRIQRDSKPHLNQTGPPQSILEENVETHDSETHLPPEVLHVLKSVRVFGHFEKPLFLEICKNIDSVSLSAGDFLFQKGDPDENIFVVQSGKLSVYITEEGNDFPVKEVSSGESIHSLLSVLDILTENPAPYKTVSAKAMIDSIILRVPIKAFCDIFERFPESLIRIIQVIMVRCQRVTFMALHNYLGLSHELINQRGLADMTFSHHTLSSKGSPTKETKDVRPKRLTSHVEEGYGSKKSLLDETDLEWSSSDFDAVCSRAGVSSTSATKVSSEAGTKLTRSKAKRSTSSHEDLSEESILQCCMSDIMRLFGLKDVSLLEGRLTLKNVCSGTVIARQDDQDADLVFVVTGSLKVLQQVVGKESEETTLFIVHPGEIIGSLSVLTGEPNFFSIRARTNAKIITLSKTDFYSIMREYPRVVLNVAYAFSKRMSPFVRQIDFALDWVHIEAARPVFRQDEPADSLYIILNGRLRLVNTLDSGKKELSGEYGRGELVGLMEVLTHSRRTNTAFAVRDTEVAKLPTNLLNLIKRKYPRIVTRLIHLISQKILHGHTQPAADTLGTSLTEHSILEQRPMVSNVSTVAIVPISKDTPIMGFTLELNYALGAIGSTLRLTSAIIMDRLGSNALDTVNEYRTQSWLAQQEDIHRIIIYQCDSTLTQWTQRCIRQADCVIIVGVANTDPKVGQIEKQLDKVAVRAQKELILLHEEESSTSARRHASDWLNIRGWVSSNHHVRCPKRVFSKRADDRMLALYEKLGGSKPDVHSDFSRLARFLTGTSVGLVLGGGGARGISQLGIIKAMRDVGVPVDMVGGTSIGSFVGALWAEHTDITPVVQQAREFSKDMSGLWNKILDLTYPVTSMFSGGGFNNCIETVFRGRQIEDLWIPYFCITTDITASKMRVHRTGSLWRYVRSSMSLAGYLPPLCDPQDGHLLLDGGYVNNLPADIMKAMGAKTIFAVNVGSEDESDLFNYGDKLSGWWLLWKRWNPWASPVKVPNMSDIQSRLAYVSCVRQMEDITKHGICEVIRPPIDKYATLQFGSFDEIFDVGCRHGKMHFAKLAESKKLSDLLSNEKSTERMQKTKMANASFTDLAELVSQINEPEFEPSVSDIEEEMLSSDSEENVVTATMSNPQLDPGTRLDNNTDGLRSTESEDSILRNQKLQPADGSKTYDVTSEDF